MSIDQKIDMSSRLFQKQITFIEIRDENDAKEKTAYLQKVFQDKHEYANLSIKLHLMPSLKLIIHSN